MSLITRCPACGTMFKVVADQLKVSQGWVRCGQCAEVFDASLNLQKGHQAALLVPGPPSSANPDPELARSDLQVPSLPAAFVSQPSITGPFAGADLSIGQTDDAHSDFDPAGWKQQRHTPQLDESGSLRVNELGRAVRTVHLQTPSIEAENQAADLTDLTDFFTAGSADGPRSRLGDTTDDVSFVRDARRDAFWRKTPVRIALGSVGLLLAMLLVLQVIVQQRDHLSALQPGLRPWLRTLCAPLNCVIEPLRHIETVVIDSSSFNKIGADSYRLTFLLKNTGSTPVAMPSLEITLTDTQEQAVLRRVLTPAQFGATSAMLGAESEFAGLVVMQVLELNGLGAASQSASATNPIAVASAASTLLRVAGYRVLAFYP